MQVTLNLRLPKITADKLKAAAGKRSVSSVIAERVAAIIESGHIHVKAKKEFVKTSVSLDAALALRLEKFAAEQGISPETFLREATEEVIAETEDQPALRKKEPGSDIFV